jgi:hypothetical protein
LKSEKKLDSRLLNLCKFIGGIRDKEHRLENAAGQSGTLVSCRRNNMPFVAIKMGRRQGARSGAYLHPYATDEQRGRQPIFIATLWAAASWLLFHVARSLHIDLDMLVARALKISQLTCGERYAISATGHNYSELGESYDDRI